MEWKLPAVVVIIKMINIAWMTLFTSSTKGSLMIWANSFGSVCLSDTHLWVAQNEVEKSAKIFHLLPLLCYLRMFQEDGKEMRKRKKNGNDMKEEAIY